MVLTEALAHGLPIVSTRGGAAAEILPDEVALKVPAGDPAALGEALASLLDDGSAAARWRRLRFPMRGIFRTGRRQPLIVAACLKNGRT